MSEQYFKCPHCGSRQGEKCNCQKIDIQAKKIRKVDKFIFSLAVLKAVEKAFEDPVIAEDYQRWLADRKNRRRKKRKSCSK